MDRSRPAVLSLLLPVLLGGWGGCATLPRTGAPATGEPLGTALSTEPYVQVVHDKVAEVQYQDAAGRSVGSAALYEDRAIAGVVVHWTPTQGGKTIDDEDFFRISGDVEAARALHDYRVHGLVLNRIGIALLVAGAGGLVAYRLEPDNRIARIAGAGSALSLLIGGIWTLDGLYRVDPQHHLFELDRASGDASDYNDRRAHR